MNKYYKNCFNCGKEYKLCYNCNPKVRFSWREVCCCPECYAEYLDKINGNFDTIEKDVKKSRKNKKIDLNIQEDDVLE